jgi:hypothetical protein
MTCIVGIVENGVVTLGGDSAGVDVRDIDITLRKDVKVFKNKEFVMGYTTSFRMGQLLRFRFVPPTILVEDLYEYMCTTFVDAVRECFDRYGFMQKYEKGDEKGGEFLVGVRGRLFSIEDDYQVTESIDNYRSVGCGMYYALGSLETTDKATPTWSTKERLSTALTVAEKYSGGVVGPFNYVSTETHNKN